MPVSLLEQAPRLRVSYSSLNVYESCKRKFEFNKLYPKRVREQQDWYAANVGKALHAGYQDYLIHRNKDKAVFVFMMAFPFAMEYNQNNDYRGFDASLCTLEAMIDSSKLDEWELAYIRRPNTPEEIKAGLSGGVIVPAIEVPFEIRVAGVMLPDGRGFSFTGFIDAILRHKFTGIYRTMDIKTTREHVEDATPKFRFDTQQVPYGIVVDHVANGEVDSFEVLYFNCFIDLVEPDCKVYKFTKTREDIHEWAMNKLLQFRDIARFSAADYFPRTENGCLFYKKPCHYLDVCQTRSKLDIAKWFLMGEEAADVDADWNPWVIADLDLGGA